MIEITMTEIAKMELLKVLRHFGAKSVRLIQQGFGWIGPRLAMVLDEPREEDEIVHLQGIEFVYNKHEKDLFNQTLIDYNDSWYGERFVVCSPTSEPCWNGSLLYLSQLCKSRGCCSSTAARVKLYLGTSNPCQQRRCGIIRLSRRVKIDSYFNRIGRLCRPKFRSKLHWQWPLAPARNN